MLGPPSAPGLPKKLDIQLEGLAVYQAGAAGLKAGDALALRTAEGRLECVTQAGDAVGLIPADKRNLLSRGPWAGTVRSVKRRPAAAAVAARVAGETGGAAAAAVAAPANAAREAAGQPPAEAAETPSRTAAQSAEGSYPTPDMGAATEEPAAAADEQQQQQQGAAAPAASAATQVVVQVLVRFLPEEQRWAQRGEGQEPAAPEEDEDMARLSREQLEALAANEEVQWMLRDERLQKVVADIDAAPGRERALVRALQAPNFKDFADKVLSIVAPDPS